MGTSGHQGWGHQRRTWRHLEDVGTPGLGTFWGHFEDILGTWGQQGWGRQGWSHPEDVGTPRGLGGHRGWGHRGGGHWGGGGHTKESGGRCGVGAAPRTWGHQRGLGTPGGGGDILKVWGHQDWGQRGEMWGHEGWGHPEDVGAAGLGIIGDSGGGDSGVVGMSEIWGHGEPWGRSWGSHRLGTPWGHQSWGLLGWGHLGTSELGTPCWVGTFGTPGLGAFGDMRPGDIRVGVTLLGWDI